MDLLTDALKHTPIAKVAESLNVCVGTVRRWIELNDVPVQYTFDLHRLLGRPIEYAN
jgi:hypothetical protein